jgi:hypothetical protein
MRWLAWLGVIAILGGEGSAEPARTPYDAGRFDINLGFYQQGRELRGIRVGGGYYVAPGFEVGLDVIHFWGQPANVEGVAPYFKYFFTGWYDSIPLVPYIGAGYEHLWTDPNYYVPDSFSARAGLALTFPTNTPRYFVILGAGVVVDHPVERCPNDNCDQYQANSDHIGPEVFVTAGF